MPEGHTLHRLARAQQKRFGGQVIALSSPQGRFVTGAELLDGRRLVRVEAFGKHLFQHYQGAPALHVHLGLYGKFTIGSGEPPEPQGALRLRMVAGDAWSDLRGPTACELMDPPAVDALRKRLGPDPLAAGSDAGLAYRKIARSRVGDRRTPDGSERAGRHRKRLPGRDPVPSSPRPLPPGHIDRPGAVVGPVVGSGHPDAGRSSDRPDRDRAAGRPPPASRSAVQSRGRLRVPAERPAVPSLRNLDRDHGTGRT